MSFSNYAYAPHFYDGSIIVLNTWFGTSPDGALDKQKKKSDSWNVPIFWGEFGCDATANGGMKFLDLFYAWLDKNNASGTQWNYTPGWTPDSLDGFNAENLSVVDNTGAIRDNYRIRPYAQRIAGTLVKFEVTRKENGAISVYLEWNHDTAKGETRIFLLRAALLGANGSNGYSVSTTGDSLGFKYDADERYLFCGSTVSGSKSITIKSGNF